jgi:hypothetical protein
MAVASPVAGRVIDEWGASRGFLVGLVSGMSAVLTCTIGYRWLHERSGHEAEAARQDT